MSRLLLRPASPYAPKPATGLLGLPSPAEALLGLWRLLIVWNGRWQDREQLREMDPRILRDIGLSRRDVEREASKPFWRA